MEVIMIRYRKCVVCGKQFRYNKRRIKCCSDECSKKRSEDVRRIYRLKHGKNYAIKKCSICGNDFKPRTKIDGTCSTKCSQIKNKINSYNRYLANNNKKDFKKERKKVYLRNFNGFRCVEVGDIMYETVKSEEGLYISAFCYKDKWYIMEETDDEKKASFIYNKNLWFLKDNKKNIGDMLGRFELYEG
jgi:predicted nucleic acid-binding Zn ribbon protein